MFERYTEKARRVIFFARYEASEFGSPYIESEHMLLGLLRENKALGIRAIPHFGAESIRQEIEKATLKRERIPTSQDLPLSNECKRVLAYAAEEAERMNYRYIGSEHLLLGLLREQACLAARLLQERGVTLETARPIVRDTPDNFLNSVEPSGGTVGGAGTPRIRPETRVVMRRSIIFQNEADDANLGETFSIDVPRVGDEVVIRESRARVTRVVYHYEDAEYEIEGRKANLKPEKVVVYLRFLEK
jgi:hypothetical protein